MTQSLNDYPVSKEWADLVSAIAGSASVEVLVQNRGIHPVSVVAGGAAAPVNKSGVMLVGGDSFTITSDHIWVKTDGGPSRLSVTAL